jgi:hypothetical protein
MGRKSRLPRSTSFCSGCLRKYQLLAAEFSLLIALGPLQASLVAAKAFVGRYHGPFSLGIGQLKLAGYVRDSKLRPGAGRSQILGSCNFERCRSLPQLLPEHCSTLNWKFEVRRRSVEFADRGLSSIRDKKGGPFQVEQRDRSCGGPFAMVSAHVHFSSRSLLLAERSCW